MKNLPLKKGIEKLLEQKGVYSGVWKVKDKEMYVKLTSKLRNPIATINPSDYDNFNDALKDTIDCAKVYKRFIKEGLYHPDTDVVICKDDKDNLTLMVTMPELNTDSILSSGVVYPKLQDFLKRIGLDPSKYKFGDLSLGFNWGYDKKTNKIYAHDIHLRFFNEEILSMAKELGYR